MGNALGTNMTILQQYLEAQQLVEKLRTPAEQQFYKVLGDIERRWPSLTDDDKRTFHASAGTFYRGADHQSQSAQIAGLYALAIRLGISIEHITLDAALSEAGYD